MLYPYKDNVPGIIEAIKGNKKPKIKNNNSLDSNILFRVTDI